MPVTVDGEYKTKTFNNNEDVWEVIDLIIEEIKETNKSNNKSFNISSSTKSQLPYFACNNIFFDKSIQQDIERYIYCEDFKIAPYEGGYDNQPAMWIQKAFIIKKALNNFKNKVIKDGTT